MTQIPKNILYSLVIDKLELIWNLGFGHWDFFIQLVFFAGGGL